MQFAGGVIGFAFAVMGAFCLEPAAAAPPVARQAAAAVPPGKATGGGEAIPGFGARVDKTTLAKLSGGTNVIQTITLNGSVSNTSTVNVSTGFNSIGGGAFANAAGLPMVIQNSGNSVLIQNATIVNLQMQP